MVSYQLVLDSVQMWTTTALPPARMTRLAVVSWEINRIHKFVLKEAVAIYGTRKQS